MTARQCVWLNRTHLRVLKGRDCQVELFGGTRQVELLQELVLVDAESSSCRAVRKSSSGRLL